MATQSPLSLVTDPAKINPVGASQTDLEEYQKSLDAQIKALEQRYAQPNWFNVAAGFAKPQLGGFLASLGSASQALGETEERRREAELPVAQMRTQLAQSKILTGQNKTQADEFEAWRNSGKPMDEKTYARIVSLQPESAVAKAAKGFFDAAQTAASTKQTQLSTETGAMDASGRDPRMAALADVYAPSIKPEQRQKAEQIVFESKPPGTEDTAWRAMSPYDRAEEVRKYAASQRELQMDKEGSSLQQAKISLERMPLLHSIRETAVQPGMDRFLGVFRGNDLMSIIARAATDGKLVGGKLEGFDEYFKQANLKDPVELANAQNLIKQLAELQVRSTTSINHPTDLSRQLQATATPGLGNTQRSLLTLIDVLAYSDKHAQELHKLNVMGKVPSRFQEVSQQRIDLERDYMKNKSKLITSDPFARPADWIYNPTAIADSVIKPAKTEAPAAPGAAPAAPAKTSSYKPPPGWKKMPDGSFVKE
jgi:hypothetical protein